MVTLVRACVLILVANMAHGLGVNWGSMASHRLHPEIVVAMLKDNGIKKVKLFDADSWPVESMKGTDIEVMLGIPNDMLKTMSDDYGNAKQWVKENVTDFVSEGVNIKYVAVGNEPLLTSYNGSNKGTIFPALQNIQSALNEAGYSNIKATVPHNADVYESKSDKPSDGDFRSDVKSLMVDMVKFLDQNKSPFLVNIYPFLSLHGNSHFPFDFAFCDNKSQPISDNQYTYTNVFDANYDTLAWALKKAGVSDMKIVVGEVGWPTDGEINANATLAKRFYDGFFKKMASKSGTPLKPGEIEYYLFSLFDEDLKSVAPGFFERHWGIFRYDGKPKFPVDFSGHGQEKYPVAAKGVQYMAEQWCVFDSDQVAVDTYEVGQSINYACNAADCTSMMYGSSCNNLDLYGNFSYAFNQYYQLQNQDKKACDFNGNAHIVKQNASRGTCLFPIQIISDGVRVTSSLRTTTFRWLLLIGLFIQYL